jgi:two-component system, NarL family, sensor histidine kinase UhpB
MKKIIPLLVLLLFASQKNFAQQQQQVDSLLAVLPTTKADTNRVKTLNALSENLWRLSRYDDSKKYSNEALELSKKINYQIGEAIALSNLGIVHVYLANYPEGIKNHMASLKISEKTGFKFGLGQAHNNLGIVYMRQGNYADAIKNYNEAIKIRKEMGDTIRAARTYNNLGILYYEQGNYKEALKSYFASLEIIEPTGDKFTIANSYMNIGLIYDSQNKHKEALEKFFASVKIFEETGNKRGIGECYHNIGLIYRSLDNFSEALTYHFKALTVLEDIGAEATAAIVYQSIGNIFNDQGKYAEALKNFNISLKKLEKVGDQSTIAIIYNSIGTCHMFQNQNAEAISFFNKSILIAKKLGAANTLKESYDHLSDTYARNKDYQNAFLYHQLFSDMKDTLFSDNQIKQIEEMKTKYETEKKDAEILLLNKDNQLQDVEIKKQTMLKYAFISGLSALIFLSFIILNNFRVRNKLKLQTLRNKIASDLHDDVGSTLSSIAIFSEVAQQQSKEVIPMLNTISDSARNMLDAMADIVWTINPENDQFEKIILRMRSFAYQLLGAKKIHFEFDADETAGKMKLPMDVRKNLYLIFKEATNNLVKYSEASKASFKIKGEKNYLTLLIRDNGKGFDTNAISQGNGLKNMRKRAQEIKAKFLIESISGSGTTVQLVLTV